jgi:apolipoprotein N-acyltransferase
MSHAESTKLTSVEVPSRWQRLTDTATEVLALVLSSLLFALSFPISLTEWGFFPLAFLALTPAFWVICRAGWAKVVVYGALYGYLSYALFNYWLATFHPLAIIIVPVIYLGYFLVLFPVLKAAIVLFPKYGHLVQLAVWLSYEYLRTLGFLGYSYGVLGYTQYLFVPFIRIAAVTGVWGVTLLVVFPSVYLGNALGNGLRGAVSFVRDHVTELLVYVLLFAATLAYGFVSESDLSSARSWRVALIQQNVDPWKGGVRAYERSLEILRRESQAAMAEDPDVVIWSETSFVPAIHWHTKYRTNRESYRLVRELREFLAGQDVPYVIGNDDGRLERNDVGELERVDYNATLLYTDGEFVEIYRKVHLVPFTENFPFDKQLPGIYQWLKEADTHFWKKGTEFTVFEADGVAFSTPICFEDTFGYLSREFVRQGAQIIVNMTNDSWSNSVPAMQQHMAMSVFRAVENKRTVVRSTNGGTTCTIDPNGRITAMLEQFVEGHLVTNVSVYAEEQTLYTRWGDWFGQVAVVVAVALLLSGIVRILLVAKRRNGR